MVAVSISSTRGKDGFKFTDLTVGTSAPGAGDFEFRYNLLDTNSAAVTRKDLVIFLEALRRGLLEGPLISNAPPL